jgi:hypothetical protein
VPDRNLVEEVAADLGTRPGLIEKDWHVVRTLSVIAQVETAGMTPAFSGGTSLSKGWELIKRFSEDIDFKVGEPATSSASRARRARTAYRERVLAALTGAGFELEGKPVSGNESRYFSADLAYGGEFEAGQGLRPHIRVEMSFQAPALPPVARPIRSLVATTQKQPAEVPSFPCVDPVETAADKVGALAWRVCARDRARPGDDPTIIRHLHDLAALERHVASAPLLPSWFSPRLPPISAGEGRGHRSGIRPRHSPRCCAGLKPILYGRGNTKNSCGRCRSPGPGRRCTLWRH